MFLIDFFCPPAMFYVQPCTVLRRYRDARANTNHRCVVFRTTLDRKSITMCLLINRTPVSALVSSARSDFIALVRDLTFFP